MTAEQAEQYFKDGEKVRCKGWRKGEYIKLYQYTVDESGFKIDKVYFEDFKDFEWEIVE